MSQATPSWCRRLWRRGAAMPAAEDVINEWWDSPPRFVREVFGATPDPWQDEVLAAFPRTPRLAMKACKGPGKTTVLAWLAWNFLLTRDDPKIAATSVSGDNLADNLWARSEERRVGKA